jgi:hypothetical protein
LAVVLLEELVEASIARHSVGVNLGGGNHERGHLAGMWDGYCPAQMFEIYPGGFLIAAKHIVVAMLHELL